MTPEERVDSLQKKIRRYGDERQAEAEADMRGSHTFRNRHAMAGARVLMDIEQALYELCLLAEKAPVRASH